MERYGIYDTKDNCWIGDDKGPRLYDDSTVNGVPVETFTKIAAQIAEKMLGYGLGRLRARPFDNKPVRFKDEVPTQMGPLEALERIEGSE